MDQSSFVKNALKLDDCFPYDSEANAFIVANQAIPHAIHLVPSDVGILLGEPLIQTELRKLANLQDVENTGFLQHAVFHKGLKALIFAVFQGVVNMCNDLLKNLARFFTVHR